MPEYRMVVEDNTGRRYTSLAVSYDSSEELGDFKELMGDVFGTLSGYLSIDTDEGFWICWPASNIHHIEVHINGFHHIEVHING